MAIPYEPNILRITKAFGVSYMPECSIYNAIGISEDEAKVIAQRHHFNLEIRTSEYLPDFRVFKFEERFVKRTNPEGGGETETT